MERVERPRASPDAMEPPRSNNHSRTAAFRRVGWAGLHAAPDLKSLAPPSTIAIAKYVSSRSRAEASPYRTVHRRMMRRTTFRQGVHVFVHRCARARVQSARRGDATRLTHAILLEHCLHAQWLVSARHRVISFRASPDARLRSSRAPCIGRRLHRVLATPRQVREGTLGKGASGARASSPSCVYLVMHPTVRIVRSRIHRPHLPTLDRSRVATGSFRRATQGAHRADADAGARRGQG